MDAPEQWPAIDASELDRLMACTRIATRAPYEVTWRTASGARFELRITPGPRTSPGQLLDMQAIADTAELRLARDLNRL